MTWTKRGIRRLVFSFWVLSIVAIPLLCFMGVFSGDRNSDYYGYGDDETLVLLLILFTVIPWGAYFLGCWTLKGFQKQSSNDLRSVYIWPRRVFFLLFTIVLLYSVVSTIGFIIIINRNSHKNLIDLGPAPVKDANQSSKTNRLNIPPPPDGFTEDITPKPSLSVPAKKTGGMRLSEAMRLNSESEPNHITNP